MKTSLVLIFLMATSVSRAELTTVPYVDLPQYTGTWYQIARNPHPFEFGCVCARQVLQPMHNGLISVYNSCNDSNVTGPLKEIRGVASSDDVQSNSKFTVDFNLPQKGTYWVIGLDAEYRYAVVSDKNASTLYVLSKTPTLSPDLYDEAVKKAAEQLDVTKLTSTPQNGCSYP